MRQVNVTGRALLQTCVGMGTQQNTTHSPRLAHPAQISSHCSSGGDRVVGPFSWRSARRAPHTADNAEHATAPFTTQRAKPVAAVALSTPGPLALETATPWLTRFSSPRAAGAFMPRNKPAVLPVWVSLSQGAATARLPRRRDFPALEPLSISCLLWSAASMLWNAITHDDRRPVAQTLP